MVDEIRVQFKSVGLSFLLDDATGASTSGQRRYRVRLHNASGQTALSYLLTLNELAVLHVAITEELYRRRTQLGRKYRAAVEEFRESRQSERRQEDQTGGSHE